MWFKVCGITAEAEVRLLAGQGVDAVGIWYGVPSGPYDLPLGDVGPLARAAGAAGLEPVLVTLLDDPRRLAAAVAGTGVPTVQLHGYLTPARLAAIRAALPGTKLVKVLHVRGDRVLERPFLTAFNRAGCDAYLFDSVGDNGRIGSTGHPLDPPAVAAALPRLDRPFVLAGGLTAANAERHRTALAHEHHLGIDVDSGARDAAGNLSPALAGDIRHAWHTARRRATQEEQHALPG